MSFIPVDRKHPLRYACIGYYFLEKECTAMYSDAMCRLAARVIIVDLGARVILTRSGICAAHTGVPKKSANGCYSAATLA